MPEAGPPPSLEAYFDLAGLVPLFEAAGLAENPGYASFAAEFRRLDTLGVSLSASRSSLNLDARLTLHG